jgi:hypothetical protein
MRDRIRHRAADALLAHDDRPDVDGGRELGQGVQRVREQDVHTFALQDICNDLPDVHGHPRDYLVRPSTTDRVLLC